MYTQAWRGSRAGEALKTFLESRPGQGMYIQGRQMGRGSRKDLVDRNAQFLNKNPRLFPGEWASHTIFPEVPK